MVPITSRNKAALCHLAPFTMVGIVVLAYAIKSIPDDEHEFVEAHAQGAIIYQILGFISFGLSLLLLSWFWDPSSTLDTQLWSGLFLLIVVLALLVYLLGSVVLAMQAWSGREFDLAVLNRWVYDEQ